MTATLAEDWSPGSYDSFRGFRLRPALDLLARVGALPAGPVVDLGCGTGAAAGPLRARFPDRALIGVDTSPAMLAEAEATGHYDRLDAVDAREWRPGTAPALIFSNALLQWLPDHGALFPRLARAVAPGGVFAVQMPGQHDAPSHRLLREVSAALFPRLFDWSEWRPPVREPASYERLLAPLGPVDAWETTYLQRLAPAVAAHPVRRFTASTAMRPIRERLDEGQRLRFEAAYDAALHEAYEPEPDGSVLFPFRRIFAVVTRLG